MMMMMNRVSALVGPPRVVGRRLGSRRGAFRKDIPLRKQREPTLSGNADEGGRQSKRKIALLLGYRGTAYYGMQKQGGTMTHLPTIEQALEKALAAVGCVSEANQNELSKIGWSRSARTDKHVSAARTMVSAKLMVPEENLDTMVDRLNENLPEDIRVFDAVRVPKKFDCKTACDRRRYTYLLPTIMLAPEDVVRAAFATAGYDDAKVEEIRASIAEYKREAAHRHAPMLMEWQLPDEVAAKVATALSTWRADAEVVSRLRAFLNAYEGTRRFHNFTAKMKADDVRAKRYIISFEAEEPYLPVAGPDKCEWIRLEVVGQSFILHQIRKMVAVAVEAAKRPATTPATAQATLETLCTKGLNFPLQLVPGNGLYLHEPIFGTYNEYKAEPPIKPRLEWLEDHPKHAEMEAFRTGYVESGIVAQGSDEAIAPWVEFLWRVRIFGFPLGPEEGSLFGNDIVPTAETGDDAEAPMED